MVDATYLSPNSINRIETKEVNEQWGEHHKKFRIIIYSGIASNGANMSYTVEFDLTKEGFQIKKEKIDPIINNLFEAIRHPLTCGFIIKLTYSKDSYFYYNIEFI